MVPGSRPLPTSSAPIFSANLRPNSSATDSWTRNRFAAVQASPMFRIFAPIAPSTAASMSASSKTRNGALPPSSIEVRSTLFVACAMSCLPTGVEPVKDTFRSLGSSMMGFEIADAEAPETTLSTPAGSPASSIVCAKYWLVSGVRRAGLRTMVHPAATAGATLRVPIARGKFHGVMSRHGPTGLRTVSIRRLPSGVGA